jgi:hypothetical protein
MTSKEALAVLVAVYPVLESQLRPPTERAYLRKMADIPGALLEATITALTDRPTRFPPAPGEIRHMAASLAGLLPMSADEALAIVRAADMERPVFRRDRLSPDGSVKRAGEYAYTEREWAWPDDLPAGQLGVILATLARVGDPVGRDGAPIFGWEQSFRSTYQREAEISTREALADLSRAALPPPRPMLPRPAPRALPEATDGPSLTEVRQLVGQVVARLSRPPQGA